MSPWNIAIIGCNTLHFWLECNIFRLNQSPETALLKQGQCSNSKQPLPAAELRLTLLLRGLPIESSVIVGHGPKYYHTLRDRTLSHALSISLSIFITVCLSLSPFHINMHTLNTQHRPCPSPLGSMHGSNSWVKDCSRWTIRKGCL